MQDSLAADAGTVGHPGLRRLYSYWDDKRAGRAMPARGDIDPVDIPALLPNLILIDVHRDPLAFTCRLTGTAAVEILGCEPTGRDPIPHLAPEFRRVLPGLWRHAVDTGMPARATVEATLDARPHTFECLVLPLAEDGAEVNILLAGLWPLAQGRPVRQGRGAAPRLRIVAGGRR